jgi:hypothetical protein
MYSGRFVASRSHLEKAHAVYHPVSHRSLTIRSHSLPGGIIGIYGIVLLCLGFPDQALEQSSAAIAEARRLAHLPSLAFCLANGARLLLLIGNDAALKEQAGQLIALAAEQGFPYWSARGTIYSGWIKVKSADVAEGISLLDSGSSASRATGAELFVPHYLALLAAAYEIAGQIEQGLLLLDEALQGPSRPGWEQRTS